MSKLPAKIAENRKMVTAIRIILTTFRASSTAVVTDEDAADEDVAETDDSVRLHCKS